MKITETINPTYDFRIRAFELAVGILGTPTIASPADGDVAREEVGRYLANCKDVAIAILRTLDDIKYTRHL